MISRLTEVFVIREEVEFSEEEKEQLGLLIHDKEHLGVPEGTPVAGVEKALRTMSKTSSKPLYRGLSQKVEAKPGMVLNFKGYTSFSEDVDIADGFADSYGTKMIMWVARGKGFNYGEWYRKDLEKIRDTDPAQWDAIDGDYLLGSAEDEKEWIFPLKSKFQVEQIQIKHGVTFIRVKQL